MKYKITLAIAITILFLVPACDEKYEPKVHEPYIPIVSAFFAGDKDSCTYYDYEPDIVFSTQYLNNGYFEYTQPFDIDEDGIDDFAIGASGYRDSSITASNYWRTINFQTLNDYSIAYDYVMVADSGDGWSSSIGTSVLAAILYSDTLTNYDFIGGTYNNFQMIESGYNYEANSFDTCCGLWNKWGEDRYIGFQKIDGDTILGWMRLEMRADTDLIILKDCAIQKFSEKRN